MPRLCAHNERSQLYCMTDTLSYICQQDLEYSLSLLVTVKALSKMMAGVKMGLDRDRPCLSVASRPEHCPDSTQTWISPVNIPARLQLRQYSRRLKTEIMVWSQESPVQLPLLDSQLHPFTVYIKKGFCLLQR